ncbi:MAG: flagellar hook-associated protein FlgK [Chloroflexi bacterium]|nr:flagellar hook-associated protein FlgK [Chloroflexota bacterium]
MLNSMGIAVRALQAHQRVIEVIDHNLANINTPGYSRQRVLLTESIPFNQPVMNRAEQKGQIGTGVTIARIERFNSEYLNAAVRHESSLLSHQTVAGDAYSQIEVILHEPSEVGLNNGMSAFWSAWNDLNADPGNMAARVAVQQSGAQLSAMFRDTAQQLDGLRSNLDLRVTTDVAEINDLTKQIAAMNVTIEQVIALGNQPNDLRDQRDLLLDKLANLADIHYQENTNGGITVSLGGRMLIQDGTSINMVAQQDGSNGNLMAVRWADTNAKVALGEGELAGLLDARDRIVPGVRTSLDQLAASIITNVNTAHRAGYTAGGVNNVDFFGGADAATIDLSAAVQSDVNNIAAAAVAGAPGDGQNAMLIAQLRSTLTMQTGTATFDGYYRGVITQLGLQAQQANRTKDNQSTLVTHLTDRKDEVSSVSADEESVELIRSQRAYQAAARVITATDEMLDKLINGTGVVGR